MGAPEEGVTGTSNDNPAQPGTQGSDILVSRVLTTSVGMLFIPWVGRSREASACVTCARGLDGGEGGRCVAVGLEGHPGKRSGRTLKGKPPVCPGTSVRGPCGERTLGPARGPGLRPGGSNGGGEKGRLGYALKVKHEALLMAQVWSSRWRGGRPLWEGERSPEQRWERMLVELVGVGGRRRQFDSPGEMSRGSGVGSLKFGVSLA